MYLLPLAGLTTGYGPSHQALEDLSIIRGLPNMTIVDPCDATDIQGMFRALTVHTGPDHTRLLRGKAPDVIRRHKPDYRFQLAGHR
ncbi:MULTISPECIES: hypothetical protein [unclassified Paracoccus (in: a-proteobacteria)]|uniref:hypothetical protein n=1 Tax=unclassified Paracoccus (in: a-proteobacteria) TaxID=2688777 RepID=UPI002E12C3CD|nr:MULTISPECIES: hypothetical protein [unclassified Paracoccus (in: a-proteobacteria)]